LLLSRKGLSANRGLRPPKIFFLASFENALRFQNSLLPITIQRSSPVGLSSYQISHLFAVQITCLCDLDRFDSGYDDLVFIIEKFLERKTNDCKDDEF
jgi:hypothetical protein